MLTCSRILYTVFISSSINSVVEMQHARAIPVRQVSSSGGCEVTLAATRATIRPRKFSCRSFSWLRTSFRLPGAPHPQQLCGCRFGSIGIFDRLFCFGFSHPTYETKNDPLADVGTSHTICANIYPLMPV